MRWGQDQSGSGGRGKKGVAEGKEEKRCMEALEKEEQEHLMYRHRLVPFFSEGCEREGVVERIAVGERGSGSRRRMKVTGALKWHR